MRFRLRTLLIVVALLPPLIAGTALFYRTRTVWTVQLNGGKQTVVFNGHLTDYGLYPDNEAVTATIGDELIYVDAERVKVRGGGEEMLPASWSRVELSVSGDDVIVLIDGVKFVLDGFRI